MASSQNLSQNQQQQLRLSPQQVRFGRLLEMSLPEFEEEINRNLEENPALEIADNDLASPPALDDEGNDFNESADQLQRADYGDEEDVPHYRLNAQLHSPDDKFYEPVAVDNGPEGLESLSLQLADLDIPSDERELAEYVIGSLDSNGYLTRSPESIADDFTMATGQEVSPRLVRKAIDDVRSLEPAGIGATDLRDCLLLQLHRLDQTETVIDATRIIRSHFELFIHHHFDRLRNALRLSTAQFDEIIALIRTLNPKPASALEVAGDSDRLSHIVPDFEITVDPDGAIKTAIAGNLPELAVAPGFTTDDIESAEHSGNSRSSREAVTFLKERNEAAREFIDMAHRRYNTLSAVIRAIAKLQAPFFRSNDRAALRPMVLRDVRELTGLDLSVISRATAGKYAMTPGGMVSLKSLFSEKVDAGGDLSVAYIESLIRKLIEGEDKDHPLSDEAICAALAEKNVDVARRTVAKYRERMGIPVARLRRH